MAKENFQFTKGEDLVKTYESELAPRNFCSNCGSSIYDDLGEVYFVAAGLMGDLDMEPSFHQLVAYKASWHQIGDDAPQYAELPPAEREPASGYFGPATFDSRRASSLRFISMADVTSLHARRLSVRPVRRSKNAKNSSRGSSCRHARFRPSTHS